MVMWGLISRHCPEILRTGQRERGGKGKRYSSYRAQSASNLRTAIYLVNLRTLSWGQQLRTGQNRAPGQPNKPAVWHYNCHQHAALKRTPGGLVCLVARQSFSTRECWSLECFGSYFASAARAISRNLFGKILLWRVVHTELKVPQISGQQST